MQQLGHCRAELILGMHGQCFHATVYDPRHVMISLTPSYAMQLAQEVSMLYSSTVPGYSRHIGDMLHEVEFTNIKFPGEQQDTSSASCLTCFCTYLPCSSIASGHDCRALGLDALKALSSETMFVSYGTFNTLT